MKRKSVSGVSFVEFTFSLVVLVPLLLGTVAVSLNLLLCMQTAQVARDAGHMYARQVDFGQPDSQTILVKLASGLGLADTHASGIQGSPGVGNAVVILSQLTYIDAAACQAGGSTYYSGGAPTSACRNWKQWVFVQRVVVGNSSMNTSRYGSPLLSGTGHVTLDSNNRVIQADQLGNTNDQASFAYVNNPYDTATAGVSDLPTGQVIYVAETAAKGFSMPPFMNSPVQYSYGMF